VDLTKRLPFHPSKELLEEYLFRRLPEERVALVEEHLLICEHCQSAFLEIEAFVSGMKAAAARPAPRQFFHVSKSTGLGMAATAVLLLLAFVVFRTQPFKVSTPAAVMLSSNRGFQLLAEAPSGKPLQLNIETPGLTLGQQYALELVNSAGRSIWKGSATYGDGKLAVQVPKLVVSGVYWVRLYDAEGRQLREFGMSAQ
jgi:hypothetical protein